MMFESTPSRSGEPTDPSPNAASPVHRFVQQTLSDSSSVPESQRPLQAEANAVTAAAREDDDDGSPYASRSIKLADYFNGSSVTRAPSEDAAAATALLRPNQPRIDALPPPEQLQLRRGTTADVRVVYDSRGGRTVPSAETSIVRPLPGSTPASVFRGMPIGASASAASLQFSSPAPKGGSSSPASASAVDVAAAWDEVTRQRQVMQQVAQELKAKQQTLATRELELQEREVALRKREQEVEAAFEKLTRSLVSESRLEEERRALAERERYREEAQNAMREVEEYRGQLRVVHKELSARELEIEGLSADLHRERERIAKHKLELDAREAALAAEQEDHTRDVKHHASKIQASATLLEEKLRDVERREAEMERVHYEWELRQADLVRREAEVQRRERDVKDTSADVYRVFDAARGLEVHAIQLRRAQERMDERERALWHAAASSHPSGAKALTVIADSLRATRSSLDALGQQVPAVLALSRV